MKLRKSRRPVRGNLLELLDGALLPGMFADVKFKVDAATRLWSSSRRADRKRAGYASDRRAGQHDPLPQSADRRRLRNTREIIGGLQGNRQIISTPGEKVVEGPNVGIVNAQSPAAPGAGQKSEKVAEAGRIPPRPSASSAV